MRLGINRQAQIILLDLAGERIDLLERFDFVAPQTDAIGVVVVGGLNFDDVAAHAKSAALEIAFMALIQDVHQPRSDLLPLDFLPLFEHQQHAVVRFGRAEAVDAAHAGDDHAIAPLEQRARGGETELVQLVVNGRFFFDVHIA